MTSGLRQLVSASKQHVMTVHNQHTDQQQLDCLQRELADMNKLKVIASLSLASYTPLCLIFYTKY